MAKLSIIIPTYNILSDEINKLISSIKNQTIGFNNVEIVFVDNNSLFDNSKKLILELSNKYENINSIFLNKHHNIEQVYNIGLKNTTTNYVIFFNMNHLLEKNSCLNLYDEIHNNQAEIVIGNYECLNGIDSSIEKYFPKRTLINQEDINYNIFYINFVLSSRIYNKKFILNNFSFEEFISWNHFNFLTITYSTKTIIINKTISIFKENVENKKITNLNKLIIFNKIIRKQFSDLTIAIKSPNPSSSKEWGDYFFAISLKESLQKKGFNVVVHEREYWNSENDNEDIVLVLRGTIEYHPNPNHLNLMWNISHPCEISFSEYEKYDLIFIASNYFANKISKKLNTPVKPLLQCTNPKIFYPSKNEKYNEDILFVGITRKIFRKIIKDISSTQHNFSVYGYGWGEFIDERFIKGDFIPNNILNQAYSSCKILLNDHWEDMLENDFPSNRLFDALACGTFIISDNIAEANDIFEGSIITYNTVEELDLKLKYYLKHDSVREALAKKGQDIVLKNHTFENRVDDIIKFLEEYSFNEIY